VLEAIVHFRTIAQAIRPGYVLYSPVKRGIITMADRIILSSPSPTAQGSISAEEYMEHYAQDHYEWVKGKIIKMAPVTDTHDRITGYLYKLLDAYLSLRPIGVIRREPFVMQLDVVNTRREPDLQVILKDNPDQLTHTAMIGPADIVIEVVSLDSSDRDYGKKFSEYEQAGVHEYWIIDPLRSSALMQRLNAAGRYELKYSMGDDEYSTALLPGFKLHVATLWQAELPDYYAIAEAVREMLKG
jgi:Uma2 family endonuclease